MIKYLSFILIVFLMGKFEGCTGDDKCEETKAPEINFEFLLGEVTARYLAPGRAGMVLTIGIRTSRLGNKSFDQEYEVACGELVLARISARLVWADKSLSSCVIPPKVRTGIATFEGIAERS